MFAETIARLQAALTAPLPGVAAQLLMSPVPPRNWPPGLNPARIRNAAGLLLVFPRKDEPRLVLTVRADTLERHGGQVSLPGGVVDPGETFEQAAVREAHEEIGLDPSIVRTLGALTPVEIHVSGFRLHPVVAAASVRPGLRAADREVARILEVPLARLLDPSAIAWRTMTRDDRTVTVPVFLAEHAEIWGATAMVLAEFLTLLGWPGPPRR